MSESTPDRTPAGWPYLTDQHYIDIIGPYTVELANKLQNSDADVAGAINAAQQATAAAASVPRLAAGVSSGSTAASSHSRSVSFPAGRFTTAPTVTLTPNSTTGRELEWVYRASSISKDGFILWLLPNPGVTQVTGSTITVSWQAIEVS